MKFRDLIRRGKKPLPGSTKDTPPTPGDGEKDVAQYRDYDDDSQPRDDVDDAPVHDHSEPPVDEDPALQELSDEESDIIDSDPAPESLSWDTLWAEAHGILRDDPEHTDLLEAFEKFVLDGKDVGSDAAKAHSGGIAMGTEKLGQIQDIAKQKLEKLPEARLSFSIGGKKIVVRDVVRKTIGAVTTFKDIISFAISAEPCAGLAWAGIMSILPLVENTLQQDDDAADGLKNIVYLLVRYRRLQDEILAPEFNISSLSDSARAVFNEIRTKIVSIYAQVYVFEIRFVLQFARGRAHRAARNVVSSDSWKDIWAGIDATSKLVDQGVREHVSARMLESVNDIIARSEIIESLQRTTLESVQDGNQTSLLLSLSCATNAMFDSAAVVGTEAPCLEGTRRDILRRIQDWAESPAGEVIFWLHGMAGTGKTSVSLTVANALSTRQPFAEGRDPPVSAFLGASFFFKQGDATRNGTKTFFPTLAQCLAQGFPDLKTQIADSVAKNLQISSKAPLQQLDGLLVKPISVLDENTLMPVRLVIVVDALDECVSQKEVRDLIGMLEALEVFHQVQIRVLITSRRDDHILKAFGKLPDTMYRPSVLDKVQSTAEEDEMDDITRYLTHTLARIADDYDVEPDWIDEDSIARLGKQADGLFIYAATICRFLDSEDFEDEDSRQERLDQIFEGGEEADAPQNKVDEMYLKVLSFPHLAKSTQVTKTRFYDTAKKILGFITVFFKPVSASSLSLLLQLEKEELYKTLRKLHAVLDVRQDPDAPVGVVHLSFRDFLLDEERSSGLAFRVEEAVMHRAVFDRCLDLMQQGLSEDMCGLVLPGHLASDVPQSVVDMCVPQYLQYACRYWADHLEKLSGDERREAGLADGGPVHVFVAEKLLFWLEAMSLIGEMSAAVVILDGLGRMVDSVEDPTLYGLLNDARRFVLRNRWVIGQAPLQLYSSALIFSPTNSKVRSQFRHLIPSWITRAPAIEDDWTSELSVLEGHYHWDIPIAFSPVADLLASGSEDGTTRVWDYATGTELYKFTDATGVLRVLFSPDGRELASALSDGLIKVRDFTKGKSVDLVGHTDRVTTIAFSSTSIDTLVSISWDGTFRTWDTNDGRQIHVSSFERFHENAVALSPDAEFVARGFYACDEPEELRFVELWGIEQVDRRARLEADESTTTAIAISKDCMMVAAGSSDGKVKVWDVASGQILHEDVYCDGSKFDTVMAIALRPQNEGLMAVGLFNGAIAVCRVGSLNRIASFNTGNILNDLAFSRDGMLLAAGCHEDGTVRLYDMTAKAGGAVQDVSGESPTVSVEFLPSESDVVMSTSSEVAHFWSFDDRLLQSISGEVKKVHCSPDQSLVGLVMADKTLQLWSEGMARKLATYDDDEIYSIIFSPDSLTFALRSSDMAMTRVLDSTTLEEKAKLLSFHEHPFVFSPDSRTANYVHSKDWGMAHELRAFDLRNSEERAVADCHADSRIAFSPDGQLVALDKIFDFESSPDAQDPEFEFYNCRLTLLEVATGVERHAFTPTKSPTTDSTRLEFHPAGHHMAAAGWRASVISLLSTTSGGNVHTFEVEGCEITKLAISPSGDLLAAAAEGRDTGVAYSTREIHLWNITTRIKVGRFDIDFRIMDLSISADSRFLHTSMGRIPLPPRITSEGKTSSDLSSEVEQSCLYYTPQWVVQGLDNILWIPPAYREPHPAVKDDTIAFGRLGAGVGFLKVDLAATPLSNRRGRAVAVAQCGAEP